MAVYLRVGGLFYFGGVTVAKKGSSKPSKFNKLSGDVALEYMAKGMSSAKAHMIGDATAAKIGMAKFGKAAMLKKAAAGRKRAKKG